MMGENSPAEEAVYTKCGLTMNVIVRPGDFSQWTDCDAGEDSCLLIKQYVDDSEGQQVDISVTKPIK